MHYLDIFILLTSICANTLLGAVVLHSRKNTPGVRQFLAMIGLIIIWSFANYMVDVSADPGHALLWTRILYSFALGYIALFLLFARSFSPVPPSRIPFLVPTVTLLTAAAIFVTLSTDLVFLDADLGTSGLSDLSFGLWYDFINAASLFVVGIAIAELIRKGRISGDTDIRNQVKIISIGWVIFLGLVIICAAILPEFFPSLVNASKVAPLFSVIMVACTTYSIVRHRFLDTKLIIRRSLVYSIVLGVVLGTYLTLLLTFAYVLGITSNTAAFLSGAITTVIGVYGAPRIERYFKKQTDRVFFKDVYEYADVVEELGSILNSTLHVPDLVTKSLRTLARVLKSERIQFIHESSGVRYDQSGSMQADDLPSEDGLLVPVSSIGTILLWPKLSGDPYTAEDNALLRTFASQASTALEKADLYDRLQEHALELEDRVLERTKHLEELRAGQRDFMDDISHALQTPLTVLTSAIEGIPETVFKYRILAAQSIDELTRLIRNLLSLARVDAVPDQGAAALIDVSEMMTRVTEYVQVICEQHGITLTATIEPGLTVHGDIRQLEEAVTNILSNAVRYTKDAPERRILVGCRLMDGSIELSIEDTGIGIDPVRLPHIFERFYRAQDTEGSGLGLAITKRIVERHSGSITAVSTLGTGTRMVLQFPTI